MIPKINEFHVEVTNICTLKCSGCARTRFIKQWPNRWKNHNLDADVFMDFLDIEIQGIKFNLCGNYGDPIYHPELDEFISKIKDRGGLISITTNGSHRSRDWWKNVLRFLGKGDAITFSIDGLPENFHLYRENADWASIKQAIDICVASDVYVVWKYIPFSYNCRDIDTARSLSQEFGIDDFVVTPSDRFDEATQHLQPTVEFLGDRFQSQQRFRKGDAQRISPKCHSGQEHFISATGQYSPCCYLADHRFYYKNMFGKEQKFFDIRSTTISKLISQPKVINFYNKILIDPISGCQFNCPG
jgi:MoaA/NifB/PqqE/SkfB family radical SAM enzyme